MTEAGVLPFANPARALTTPKRFLKIPRTFPRRLAKEGVECEVIDLRTLSPIDMDTVIESVENTGRLICVDEANPRCSIAADVSAMVAQEAFDALKASIRMVTAPHTPVPFSPALEDLYVPSVDAIAGAVRRTMGGERKAA